LALTSVPAGDLMIYDLRGCKLELLLSFDKKVNDWEEVSLEEIEKEFN
jgi:hypothetical protein